MSHYFRENLKEARKAKAFTQKEVAKMLNVVESCYANWEQGRTEPSIDNLQKICVILDISANDLLNLEDRAKISIKQ